MWAPVQLWSQRTGRLLKYTSAFSLKLFQWFSAAGSRMFVLIFCNWQWLIIPTLFLASLDLCLNLWDKCFLLFNLLTKWLPFNNCGGVFTEALCLSLCSCCCCVCVSYFGSLLAIIGHLFDGHHLVGVRVTCLKDRKTNTHKVLLPQCITGQGSTKTWGINKSKTCDITNYGGKILHEKIM